MAAKSPPNSSHRRRSTLRLPTWPSSPAASTVHWKNRDKDLQVHEDLPRGLDYDSMTLNSKFCLRPSGHEVASRRIVEAINAECVLVIVSEHYALPFSEVLRCEAFSIKVEVSEIWRLKKVLMGVPEKYRSLVENLRVVRRHLELNQPAKRFDAFHMTLHSVWLRRINLGLAQIIIFFCLYIW